MSFNAIYKNKILAKISESTVYHAKAESSHLFQVLSIQRVILMSISAKVKIKFSSQINVLQVQMNKINP